MIRRRPAGHRLFEVEPTQLAVQVNEASRMNRVGMLNYDEPIGAQRECVVPSPNIEVLAVPGGGYQAAATQVVYELAQQSSVRRSGVCR